MAENIPNPNLPHGHRERHIPTEQEIIQFDENQLHRKLTPHEKDFVHEQVVYMQEHKGHEAAHSEMVLIIMATLVISQILISIWKKYHVNSYNLATLLGLWIVPLIISISKRYYKFIFAWIIFSIFNTFIVRKALQSPMNSSTPRLVYYWYQKVYDISYAVGVFGYFIALMAFFHVPLALGYDLDQEADVLVSGVTILFYGLYFGTLGRDFVDRLSDKMATTMGYYSNQGFPRKHLREGMCAICGDSTKDSQELLHKLNCEHTYHEICIRGWAIVGKKDVCPYCKEKVDMDHFKTNPWDTTQLHFLQLLDLLRYLLVWNPVTFLIIDFIFQTLGLK